MSGRDFHLLAKNTLEVIKRKYCYLKFKEKEFKKLNNSIKKKITTIKTEEEYIHLMKGELSIFKDRHIRLVKDDKTISLKGGNKMKNYQENLIEDYLTKIQKKDLILLGQIKGIDYLGLNSFHPNKKEDYEWLNKNFPKNAKIIIDLRQNVGGNDEFILPLISFLLRDSNPKISSYFKFRESENKPKRLTEFIPKYITSPLWKEPIKKENKKIVVLVGNVTCSAGELAVLDLKAIPKTKTIGDKTSGLVGRPRRFLIEGKNKGKQIGSYENPLNYKSHFAIDLPTRICYDKDKKIIQGNGIEPDIFISSKKSIKNNRDLVLEKAIQILR